MSGACRAFPALAWPFTVAPPLLHHCRLPLQEKHKGVTVASFDTTEEELESLTAELGVKGLPQFRFYKVGGLGAGCCLC